MVRRQSGRKTALGEGLPRALHGRTRFDRVVPAFHVRIIVEPDIVHPVDVNVRINRNIGNRIVADDVFMLCQPLVVHAEHVADDAFVMFLCARHFFAETDLGDGRLDPGAYGAYALTGEEHPSWPKTLEDVIKEKRAFLSSENPDFQITKQDKK